MNKGKGERWKRIASRVAKICEIVDRFTEI